MKKNVRIFALLLLVIAAFFGYQGINNGSGGKDNVFIVDDKVTIEVTEDEYKIYYSFLNTSGEKISSITVNFGIKGDKNYDTEDDEVSINIENFGVLEDPFVIDFYKDDFKIGETIRDGRLAGKATINVGTNIVELEEYDYVHSISINGSKEDFNHGGSMDTTSLLIAGGAAILAIVLFVYSRNLGGSVKELSLESVDEDVQEEWNNNGAQSESEPTFVPSSSSQLTAEEKEEYIKDMEVIDMDKDEL